MNIFIIIAFFVGIGASLFVMQIIKDDGGVNVSEQENLQEESVVVEPTSAGEPSEQPVDRVPLSGATLDLSYKGLTSVSQNVFDKSELVTLNLSHNELQGSLPGEIRHLQNLKTLDLSDNNFTGVPAEIGQLKQLEVLDLSNNSITGLPYELGNLTGLKTLDLRGTNYATQDLEIIKRTLPASATVLVD